MNNELKKDLKDQLKLIQKLTQCNVALFIYSIDDTVLSTEKESTSIKQHIINAVNSHTISSSISKAKSLVTLEYNEYKNIELLSLYKKINVFPIISEGIKYGSVITLFNTDKIESNTEYLEIACKNVTSLFTQQKVIKNSQASEFLLSTIHGVPWSLEFETGKFTYVGPQSEKILCCSSEKIKTIDDWLNIIHPDDRESSLNFCLKQSQDGNDHVFSYRIIKKDGSISCIRDIVKVIQKNGITKELYGFMIDITDIKVKEQELSNVNNQLKYILNHTNTTLNIVDENQNIIFHSNEKASSIKQKCYEYFCNEKEQCKDCPALQDFNKSVTFYRNLNDSSFQVTAFPITTKNGKTHIGEVRVDLTERMKKEKQINNLKDKIEFLLTAGKISFIEYNFKTDIFDCNQVFNEITGYNFNSTPLDLNWLTSRIHPNNINLFKSELNKVIKKHKDILELEFRFLTAENKYLWFHFHGQMDSNEDSKIVGILLDITNNKRLLNELIDAKNKSHYANELKSQFLANMSHEIRTPMNAILGFTSLLKNRIKEAPYNNYITSIESSGKTLLELINDLLDLEKINSGKIELKKDKVNLEYLIDEVYQTFILFATNKGISLEIIKQTWVPSDVYIDSLKVKQILINLINNAIKFTEKGDVKIEYSFLQNNVNNDGVLNISVIDSGIGIPQEKQKLIFEPFIQEDQKSTKLHEGTGLGLSIVQKIITLMGGTIVLESTPGIGSKFSISIPEVGFTSNLDSSLATDNNIQKTTPSLNIENTSNKLKINSFTEEEKEIILIKFENILIPLWKQLSEMLSLTNLNIFVKEISEITNIISWSELENYNRNLKANVKSFDFEQLPNQIKIFKNYIDYIHNQIIK